MDDPRIIHSSTERWTNRWKITEKIKYSSEVNKINMSWSRTHEIREFLFAYTHPTSVFCFSFPHKGLCHHILQPKNTSTYHLRLSEPHSVPSFLLFFSQLVVDSGKETGNHLTEGEEFGVLAWVGLFLLQETNRKPNQFTKRKLNQWSQITNWFQKTTKKFFFNNGNLFKM